MPERGVPDDRSLSRIELGIALPTAAANLKSALRELGLPSRAELIRLLAVPPNASST